MVRAVAAGRSPGMSLESALARQLDAWRVALAGGAERVGWKLGMGDRERIGAGPVIGHLTSATRLPSGGELDASGLLAPHADAEVALLIGDDVAPDAGRDAAAAAIAGYGTALELCDLGPAGGPEDIVAANVFHRAFALGDLDRPWPPRPPLGRIIVDGETRAESVADADLAELVRVVAALLGRMGERLRAGDRLITGSVVQVPVRSGSAIAADIDGLGRVLMTLG